MPARQPTWAILDSPKAHGFDCFFGFESDFTDYWQHTNGISEPDLYVDERLIHENGCMTDLIAARSVRYAREHADEPFFLSALIAMP